MKSILKITGLMVMVAALLIGCGGQNSGDDTSSNQESTDQGLSDFEMKNGVGPVSEEITINEVDEQLAQKGAEIFDTKCSACHKMSSRYVGPPLGNILEVRTPAYVMNMILNPEEMLDEHPIAQELLKEYMTPMPNQNLSEDEARGVVEYLASEMEN